MFRVELQRGLGRWSDLAGALFTALTLALLAPITLDFRADLPITLQSLLVLWLPWVLGWRAGAAGVIGYLVLGVAGVPVFSGGAAGLAPLTGVTGGYLLMFPLAATAVGLWGEHVRSLKFLHTAAAMIAGHALILAGGLFWQYQIAPPQHSPFELIHVLTPAIVVKSSIGLLLTVLVSRIISHT